MQERYSGKNPQTKLGRISVGQNMCSNNYKEELKISSRRTHDIEALLEQLESLQITEEASSDYKQMDTEMSVVSQPAPAAISENI